MRSEMPFEVAVEIQPWIDAGLRPAWNPSMYGGGYVLAVRPNRGRFTRAQREVVGAALVTLPRRDLGVLDRTGRILGGARADWLWLLDEVAQNVNLGYQARCESELGRELLRLGGGVNTIHEYLSRLDENALRRYAVWLEWSRS